MPHALLSMAKISIFGCPWVALAVCAMTFERTNVHVCECVFAFVYALWLPNVSNDG
jgi:hypothetical protein